MKYPIFKFIFKDYSSDLIEEELNEKFLSRANSYYGVKQRKFKIDNNDSIRKWGEGKEKFFLPYGSHDIYIKGERSDEFIRDYRALESAIRMVSRV